jgi:hypothetical protein
MQQVQELQNDQSQVGFVQNEGNELLKMQGWPCVLKHLSQIDDFQSKYLEHFYLL